MNKNRLFRPRLRPARWLLVLLAPLAVTARSHTVTGEGPVISAPWARATAPGSTTGAIYFTVQNHGRQPDTLLRAASPVSREATFHITTLHDGVSRMERLPTVPLAASATVRFEPNGRHLMLTGLKQPLVAGTSIPLTLYFQHGGAVVVQVPVAPITATGADAVQHLIDTEAHRSH